MREFNVLKPEELLHSNGLIFASAQEQKQAADAIDAYFTANGIEAQFEKCLPGPTHTGFTYVIGSGLQRRVLENSTEEISAFLGTGRVTAAPLPGEPEKAEIFVPNRIPSEITLRDAADTPEFKESDSCLTCIAGMGVDGKAITIDLLRMPHLLLGGEDDAGRGMCLDDIITSLLFKAPPDQVKLILMDPGAGKFGRYSGLPHLYMPVVSDPERSCNAIQWAEAEMHERYRLMEVYGEKDIASYNNWQTDDRDKMLPRIVIVIDELEALVSKAPRKIEDSLCMLAHMGRAAGIHVIAATRRPIPEVLTLRIRVGIPDRIVFKTDSRHESRLLINSGGAEELCGNGDMIVSLIGQPDRMAKTAALTDEEISAVVDAAKSVRDLHTPDGNGEEGAAPSAGNDSGSSESREMGNESFPPLPEPTGRNRSLFHRRKK